MSSCMKVRSVSSHQSCHFSDDERCSRRSTSFGSRSGCYFLHIWVRLELDLGGTCERSRQAVYDMCGTAYPFKRPLTQWRYPHVNGMLPPVSIGESCAKTLQAFMSAANEPIQGTRKTSRTTRTERLFGDSQLKTWLFVIRTSCRVPLVFQREQISRSCVILRTNFA